MIALSQIQCPQPIQGKLAYATKDNLTGQILDGYHPDALDICLMTPKAAHALCNVQNHLIKTKNFGLFIHDSYRPKQAVRHFMRWAAAEPLNEFELEKKALHYPMLEKKRLFAENYIAEDSNHCYGNTVDVVLISLTDNHFLEMGSIFDFMGEESHHSAGPDKIGKAAYEHRQILLNAMTQFGFEPHPKEYWHYAHGGTGGREVTQPFEIEIHPSLRTSS